MATGAATRATRTERTTRRSRRTPGTSTTTTTTTRTTRTRTGTGFESSAAARAGTAPGGRRLCFRRATFPRRGPPRVSGTGTGTRTGTSRGGAWGRPPRSPGRSARPLARSGPPSEFPRRPPAPGTRARRRRRSPAGPSGRRCGCAPRHLDNCPLRRAASGGAGPSRGPGGAEAQAVFSLDGRSQALFSGALAAAFRATEAPVAGADAATGCRREPDVVAAVAKSVRRSCRTRGQARLWRRRRARRRERRAAARRRRSRGSCCVADHRSP